MDRNEFHNVVNPSAAPSNTVPANIQMAIEQLFMEFIADKMIEDLMSHDCDKCKKSGNCPIEKNVREFQAKYKALEDREHE